MRTEAQAPVSMNGALPAANCSRSSDVFLVSSVVAASTKPRVTSSFTASNPGASARASSSGRSLKPSMASAAVPDRYSGPSARAMANVLSDMSLLHTMGATSASANAAQAASNSG